MPSTFSSAISFLSLLAQIGLDDHGVVLDILGGALGDDLTEVEHADTLADAHDQIHVVLDEHDGDLEGVADLDDIFHELGSLGCEKGRIVLEPLPYYILLKVENDKKIIDIGKFNTREAKMQVFLRSR